MNLEMSQQRYTANTKEHLHVALVATVHICLHKRTLSFQMEENSIRDISLTAEPLEWSIYSSATVAAFIQGKQRAYRHIVSMQTSDPDLPWVVMSP